MRGCRYILEQKLHNVDWILVQIAVWRWGGVVVCVCARVCGLKKAFEELRTYVSCTAVLTRARPASARDSYVLSFQQRVDDVIQKGHLYHRGIHMLRLEYLQREGSWIWISAPPDCQDG